MKKSLLWQAFAASAFMLLSFFAHAEMDMTSQALAEKLNKNWDTLFNKGDVAALVKLYDTQAVVSPGNGKVLKGQQAITKLFQSFINNGVHQHNIKVVDSFRDGDILYQVAYWQAAGQEKDGVTPTFGGVVTLISKLNPEGEWKLQVHSWNMAQ